MDLKKSEKIDFVLKKETLRELCLEELTSVSGGIATAACCIGCNTSVGVLTNTANCVGQGTC